MEPAPSAAAALSGSAIKAPEVEVRLARYGYGAAPSGIFDEATASSASGPRASTAPADESTLAASPALIAAEPSSGVA